MSLEINFDRAGFYNQVEEQIQKQTSSISVSSSITQLKCYLVLEMRVLGLLEKRNQIHFLAALPEADNQLALIQKIVMGEFKKIQIEVEEFCSLMRNSSLGVATCSLASTGLLFKTNDEKFHFRCFSVYKPYLNEELVIKEYSNTEDGGLEKVNGTFQTCLNSVAIVTYSQQVDETKNFTNVY